MPGATRAHGSGDRVTALEMYEGMIRVLPDQGETRPFANLARRQKAQIETSSEGKSDRLTIVKAALVLLHLEHNRPLPGGYTA